MGGSKDTEAPAPVVREARTDDEAVETQTIAEEKKHSRKYGRNKAFQVLDVTKSQTGKTTYGA